MQTDCYAMDHESVHSAGTAWERTARRHMALGAFSAQAAARRHTVCAAGHQPGASAWRPGISLAVPASHARAHYLPGHGWLVRGAQAKLAE